jgi:hypothetical protein
MLMFFVGVDFLHWFWKILILILLIVLFFQFTQYIHDCFIIDQNRFVNPWEIEKLSCLIKLST